MGFDDKAPTSAVKEVKYYLLDTPSEKLKQNQLLNCGPWLLVERFIIVMLSAAKQL